MSITKMSRRLFVQVTGATVGAAALGGSVTGCGGKYPEVKMTDDRLVISLQTYPELEQVNEGILFKVPNNIESIVVVHTEEGYVALGATCPHQGCAVRWKKDQKKLVCPCHKAEYNTDGSCARGPGWSKPKDCAEWGKSLRVYNVVEQEGALIVTPATEEGTTSVAVPIDAE